MASPPNTCSSAIGASKNWSKPPASLKEYTKPGVTTNWNKKMRKDLLAALKKDGIDVPTLTDREAVEKVSAWLMENSGGSSADLVAQVRSLSEATLSRFAETLNDESRYWLADDRAMGASANTPTLAVLLVLACGLLLVDGFHRFHVTRSVLRFPSRCVRGGARRAGVRIERYRGRVRRHADIDQLEAEIQEWLAQQKPL